jgi:hypothetical protein
MVACVAALSTLPKWCCSCQEGDDALQVSSGPTGCPIACAAVAPLPSLLLVLPSCSMSPRWCSCQEERKLRKRKDPPRRPSVHSCTSATQKGTKSRQQTQASPLDRYVVFLRYACDHLWQFGHLFQVLWHVTPACALGRHSRTHTLQCTWCAGLVH